jgi:undecaprenyl phosphate N,N'-diacetylbacillosamine 1-phosphate transferase
MKIYSKFIKRIVDILVSLFALIVFSPIIIFLIILLSFSNKGKPFFIQGRPGRNEKLFYVIKFKTMNDKKDSVGNLLPDGIRLSPIGSFIRKTSLDELPQLINVLKGDMSLIGPRPLLVRYMPYFRENERVRHNVRPGITGLAQINGRNLLNWDERLELDVFYVSNLTLLMDLKIIIITIKNVLFAKDIVVDANLKMRDLDETRKNEKN